MLALVDKIKNGNQLSFSYSSISSKALLDHTINFENTNDVFRINSIKKKEDGHESKYSETYTAAELLDFLINKKEFLRIEDAALLSDRKPDEQLMLIFEKIRKNEKMNFSYISQKEGGRFEYDLSYNRGLHLFTVHSKEQYIGESEISRSRNLSDNDFYNFLSSNKTYLIK